MQGAQMLPVKSDYLPYSTKKCLSSYYYIPFWSLNLETSNILNSPLPLLSPYSLF